MSKHTAQPWRRRPLTLSIEGPDGRLVANALCGTMRRTTVSPPERPRAEAEANATLIAAAPLMLKALQRITHPMADDEDLSFALEAIAKATGELS